MGAIVWTDPETFAFSDQDYEHYRENDVRLRNSAVREDADEDMLVAVSKHRGSYEAIKIGGKTIDEFIGGL